MEAPASLDSSAEGSKVLVYMTVDIGDGRQGYLEVNDTDDTLSLVNAFCEEYQLPDEKKARLARLVDNYRSKALQQESVEASERPESQTSRKTPSNFGEELYYREMRHREESQLENLRRRKQEESRKLKSHTFKPITNESSVPLPLQSLQ
jgi:hypothetical protein